MSASLAASGAPGAPGPRSDPFPAGHPLLSRLAGPARVALAAAARIETPAEGAILFEEGGRADSVFLLLSGQVKMVRSGSRGYETIVEVIMPGELFGGAVILQEDNPSTAVAMATSRLLRIPRLDWTDAIKRNPELAVGLVGMLGKRLRVVMAAHAAATERVERRVAAILLRLADKTGGPGPEGGIRIGIALTRQDLADMAGTTVETAIRVMSRFRKEGIAASDDCGCIVIKDREALEKAGLE